MLDKQLTPLKKVSTLMHDVKEIDQHSLTEMLHKTFGFREFRQGQLDAITTLLTQNRLLCIQPTGHGKSLLYQLPTLLLSGLTLVISPLLALMRDQLVHLNTRFKIPAASVNSDQTEQENVAAVIAAKEGRIRILFIAPEQLNNSERFNFLLQLPVHFLVIDEAHCISTWGHDFRPSYRQIIQLVHALEQKKHDIKILGLTATADHRTESDIKSQLSSKSHDVSVQRVSMDRPNIHLNVISALGIANKLNIIMELLSQLDGCGLIYCATRENTELVAEYLNLQNVHAVAYHAGFSSEEKRYLQENFLKNQYRVVVATNALGMGIDKADLRFIIHFDMPGSITAYYQEVGRCGRDGSKAHGILIFDPADKKIQQHFIDAAQPSSDDFQLILRTVDQATQALNLSSIKRVTGLHPTRVSVIIAELLEQNYLHKFMQQRNQVYQCTEKKSQPDLSRYTNQYHVKIRELAAMLNYGEQNVGCLMANLREKLGDINVNDCGHCNVCNKNNSFQYIHSDEQIYKISMWLSSRTVKLESSKSNHMSSGVAVLDGKMRSPLFVHFMKQRAQANSQQLGVADELLTAIKQHLASLFKQHSFKCIIPIPSRTWIARDQLVSLLANHFSISAFLELLIWKEYPAARQGELLNNEQRRYNVDKKMTATTKMDSSDAILLFDDYTGSGATLKEALRVLREEANHKGIIVPFTIAAVKWHLGKPGMI